jgi:hypothetical protein
MDDQQCTCGRDPDPEMSMGEAGDVYTMAIITECPEHGLPPQPPAWFMDALGRAFGDASS